MRIAVWYNLPSGGARRALYQHVKGLLELGHEIIAWRPPIEHEGFSPIGALVEEREVPLDILSDGNSYGSKVVRHLRRPGLLMRSMQAHSEECARQMGAQGFDILFANTCQHYRAPYLGRYVQSPSALYLQEPNRPLYEPLPKLPWAALPEPDRRGLGIRALKRRAKDRFDLGINRLLVREERENARSYDAIFVNSLFSRESVLRAYGLQSKVVYLGIDTEIFVNQHRPRERFVLGLGTLGPSKNLRLAIEAVGAMPTPRPPLVWVGNMVDDPYLAEMRLLAEGLGVDFQPRVLIEDDELLELMNRAGAMVYTPRLEPFGLAPLEANACGLPVVGVAEGGVRETIVHEANGLLVDHDPKAMAEALGRVLDDPEFAARLGAAGEARVRELWSLEAASRRLESALLEVHARRSDV